MQKPSRPTPWEAVEGDDENPTGMLAYWKDEADEKFTELEQRITELEKRIAELAQISTDAIGKRKQAEAENLRLHQAVDYLMATDIDPGDKAMADDILKE